MPILKKKLSKKVPPKKTETRSSSSIADVTIDDFANSSRTSARFKKAATNVCSEVKQEVTIRNNKELSLEEVEGNNEIDLLNGSKKNQKGKTKSRKGRRKKSVETETEDVGVHYPLDIWFIISEYISPENVGKFAQICTSSYHVTKTGKFWFHLYKTYCKIVFCLPERLQPGCMFHTQGLRACVIRALHYSYFSLKKQVYGVSYLRHDDPHSLVNRRCCLMWHKKVVYCQKDRWYFFFKLKEIPKTRRDTFNEKFTTNSKKTDFFKMLEDVAINPEEGCKVLRVNCLKYSMLPPVIGLILQTVSVTLMPGFKEHRIQLAFRTSDVPSAQTNQVILNDVTNYQVLDWWDPSYPHQNQVPAIELPENVSWE